MYGLNEIVAMNDRAVERHKATEERLKECQAEIASLQRHISEVQIDSELCLAV